MLWLTVSHILGITMLFYTLPSLRCGEEERARVFTHPHVINQSLLPAILIRHLNSILFSITVFLTLRHKC